MAPLFFPVNVYGDLLYPVMPKRPRFELVHLHPKKRCLDPFWSSLFQGEDEGQIKTIKCGKDGFEAQLALSGFDDKDVKVKVDEKSNVVRVSAQKEEEKDGMKTFRQVQRSFLLPKGANKEAIKTQLDENGVLRITCPVTQALEEKTEEPKRLEQTEDKETEKEVEIEVTGTRQAETEIQLVATVEKPFEFTVNVSGFNPDNISVDLNVDEGLIIVKANQEEKSEDGSVMTKSVVKKSKIDSEVFDVEQIRSELDEETGMLKISAPRRQKQTVRQVRSVPIKRVQ